MQKSIIKSGLVFGIISLFVLVNIIPIVTSGEIKKTKSDTFLLNIWIVDDEGDGDFTGIQMAIDDVSVQDNDIIEVYSGTYNENIIVYKELKIIGYDNEYLNGDDSGKPIIDAGGSIDVIKIDADYVTISGFTIKNGFYLYSSFSGLLINSKYNTISENNIIENNRGFTLETGSSHNIICNNIIKYNDRLYLHETSDNQIFENQIIENNSTGILDMEFANNNRIFNNTIADNNNHKGASAINLFKSSNNFIYYNDIINNNGPGIFIWPESSNNIIYQNIITNDYYTAVGRDVNDYGIYLGYYSSNNIIKGNTIKGHKLAGIYIEFCSNNIILNNEISNNDEYGIVIEFGYNNHITLNNIRDNKPDASFILEIKDYIKEFKNIWSKNYWGEIRLLIKPIKGSMVFQLLTIPIIWFSFDWCPAKEPYEIAL